MEIMCAVIAVVIWAVVLYRNRDLQIIMLALLMTAVLFLGCVALIAYLVWTRHHQGCDRGVAFEQHGDFSCITAPGSDTGPG